MADGTDAETRALRFLESRGLKLVCRNWRGRGGELDLVMLDRAALVVIEVRSRSATTHGDALASIDRHKRGRIILATRQFLAAHPQHSEREVRFDAIGIDAGQLRWITAAFDADG